MDAGKLMSGDKLTDVEIGERLRLAREMAKLTQAEAAGLIGAVRTTVVAIEQGKRRVQTDELQKLAAAYGTSANALLRREAVYLDMVPRFRKLRESGTDSVEKATRLLNDLVRAEVELENARYSAHLQLSSRTADPAGRRRSAGGAGRAGAARLAWPWARARQRHRLHSGSPDGRKGLYPSSGGQDIRTLCLR
jgi:transcriptional regulator with XRE-family HTH domain